MRPSANTQKPYRNDAVNLIYDLLFCDNVALYKNNHRGVVTYPWDVLFSETPQADALQKIAGDAQLETRVKLLACNQLMQMQQTPQKKELLGIIIEVALEDGLDVVAAFADGSARYINYSEKMIIWETPNTASQQLVQSLFNEGIQVVSKIGPWNEPRLSSPPEGEVRLSFLVSDGLYFGQGPIDVLFDDPMGAPVLGAATQLMQFLADQE